MFSSRKTGSASNAYNLTKSLRFRSSAGAWLNRTPATTTNRQTYTWSGWVKTSLANVNGSDMPLLTSRPAAGTYTLFQLKNSNTLQFSDSTAGGSVTTTQVFRDPSAWYHIVLAVDTTQATAANRVKMYVNGVQITSFSSTTYPSQNGNTQINVAQNQGIGRDVYDTSALFDGYLAETNFIDGQALTPSSFGSTNATTGVWQPAKYTGTYGTNGFYLPFSDNSSTTNLCLDKSGNSNNWTPNNISLTAGSTYDSMTDVPTLTSTTTANFCTFNPLNLNLSAGSIGLSDGNLTKANNGNGAFGTIAVSSGKFYCEMVYTAISGTVELGVCDNNTNLAVGYKSDGTKDVNSFSTNSAYGSSYTTNDVIGIALDATNLTVTFYKNGVSQGAVSYSTTTTNLTFFMTGRGAATYGGYANFGQQPFTYTPPTGFVALNTYNLPTSTIVKGNTVMDATLYTGNGSTNTITNSAGFKPDFVWVKSRSAATDHKLTDSVRGVQKGLISDTTGAETTDTNGLTAFNSNGWSLGSDTVYNNNTATYVGWQWQAGQGSTSSNTNGSITSTVSANTTAGFSIVKYTGTGANATVGHGLGAIPALLIFKNRTTASTDWPVKTNQLSTNSYLFLNSSGAAATFSSFWPNDPTSSVFSVGTDNRTNGSSNAMIAYCFATVAGFSAFGSYTGNGSATGPFVYLGFQPKYLLIKRTDSTSDWYIWDSVRNTFNTVTNTLLADSGAAETSASSVNILSNGFQCVSATVVNVSTGNYIYAAFASNPFKYANAF